MSGPVRPRILGLVLLLGIVIGYAGAEWTQSALLGFASLFQAGLLCAVAVALGWFLYSFFLKRLFRARRIANIRERRLIREAMSEERDKT
jgi:hypothetical protein